MTILRSFATAVFVLGIAVARASAQMLDGPPTNLKAASAELYAAYEQAISRPLPSSIAAFYDPLSTVIRVINGTVQHTSRAALDSMYRYRWRPPAYFRFDTLTFDSLSTVQVLVTGRFRWQSMGSPDTVTFLYAALLEAADSGMLIRFEHETAIPRKQ